MVQGAELGLTFLLQVGRLAQAARFTTAIYDPGVGRMRKQVLTISMHRDHQY